MIIILFIVMSSVMMCCGEILISEQGIVLYIS